MLYFDLILMRMILAGLATVILAAVYLLTRKWLAHHARNFLLAVLLLLPLLVFLVIPTVNLPDNAPDWLLDMRLPDPSHFVLTYESIDSFFRDLQPDGKTLNAFPGQWLSDNGFRLNLNFEERVLQWLPFWSLTYLAGLLATIIINLLMVVKNERLRRRQHITDSEQFNQEAWQAEISQLRDELGYYRRAILMIDNVIRDKPSAILLDWFKHRIPVPLSDPADYPEEDRKRYLINILHRQARPNVPLFILWGIARCLVWFNPFWPLIRRQIWADRRRKNQDIRNKPAGWLVIPVSAITVVIAAAAFLLIIWQTPASLARELTTVDYQDAAPISVINDAPVLGGREELVSMDSMSLSLFDSTGNIGWTCDFSGVLTDENIMYIQLINYRKIKENRWSVIFVAEYPKPVYGLEPSAYYHALIDADGRLISAEQVDYFLESSSFYNPASLNAMVHLNDDGSFIFQFFQAASETLSANFQVDAMQPVALIGFNPQSRQTWQKGPDDPACSGLNASLLYSFSSDQGIISINRWGQLVLLSDGNFIIIRQSIFSRYFLTVSSSINDQLGQLNDYFCEVWVDYYDQQGKLIWSKKVIDGNQNILWTGSVYQDESVLFFVGNYLTTEYDEKQHLYVAAVDLKSKSNWMMLINKASHYELADCKAENGVLTVLLRDIVMSRLNNLVVLQISNKGQMTGQATIEVENSSNMISKALPGLVHIIEPLWDGD